MGAGTSDNYPCGKSRGCNQAGNGKEETKLPIFAYKMIIGLGNLTGNGKD